MELGFGVVGAGATGTRVVGARVMVGAGRVGNGVAIGVVFAAQVIQDALGQKPAVLYSLLLLCIEYNTLAYLHGH